MRFNCQNAFDIWEPRLIEMHVYAYACNYNTCTVLRMNIFPINLTILTFLTFVTFVPLFEKSANKFKLRNIFRLHSHFDWRDMRVYLLFNCKLDLFGCELMLQHITARASHTFQKRVTFQYHYFHYHCYQKVTAEKYAQQLSLMGFSLLGMARDGALSIQSNTHAHSFSSIDSMDFVRRIVSS